MNDPGAFDRFSDAYEAMIDWPKRLAREAPFFQGIVHSIGARRVLDAACGTGHHAVMFHQWGLKVEGADLSPTMIERCRSRHGSDPHLQWVVRSFDQPAEPNAFDLVICIGNSLALAVDMPHMVRSLRNLLQALRQGGALVVQLLNLWSMPDGKCQWQKCLRATLPQGERLIIKGVHRSGACGYVELLLVEVSTNPPTMFCESSRLLGITAEQLVAALRSGGAREVQLYGGYQCESYHPLQSTDLLAVAYR